MRRWLLQVDRPEADDLIYSRHRPHRSRHIAARKNYLALDRADDGTVLGPHIVDRTMVRTLRVMAKPKPSPNRKRRAQRRTGWRKCATGARVPQRRGCATEARDGRAARYLPSEIV
jgi:hypothetical protein